MNEPAWREVTRDEFFRCIGPLNVHPHIQPGPYPYTSIWRTPDRTEIGKSVDSYDDRRTLKTMWYLRNLQP